MFIEFKAPCWNLSGHLAFDPAFDSPRQCQHCSGFFTSCAGLRPRLVEEQLVDLLELELTTYLSELNMFSPRLWSRRPGRGHCQIHDSNHRSCHRRLPFIGIFYPRGIIYFLYYNKFEISRLKVIPMVLTDLRFFKCEIKLKYNG